MRRSPTRGSGSSGCSWRGSGVSSIDAGARQAEDRAMRTNRTTPTLLILMATLAAVLVGCSIAGTRPVATQLVRPYPDGCADFGFAARRCAAVVAIARRTLDVQDPTA